MPEAKPRMKLGYLPKVDVQAKIDSGELDAYDVVYTDDTWECLIVTPELSIKPIRGRVKIYESLPLAEIDINESSDTYVGQIVSVKHGEVFRGYIVNRNTLHYYLVPLWENPDPIDYNTLNNRPIINILGELENPVDIKTLEDGVYKVSGFFIMPPDNETESSVVGNIFIIEDNYITKITNKEIKKYNRILEEYTVEEYTTDNDVRSIIDGYNFVTRESMIEYIQEHFEEQVEGIVKDVLSKEFKPATDTEIENLF